jgi:hypothetical protein
MMKQVLVALVLLLCGSVVHAQPGSSTAEMAGTRPNAGGDPEQITLYVGLLDIAEIDDREQVFMADIYVQIEWQDSRLAVVSAARNDLRTVELDDIWHPRLTVINSRGLDRLFPETATVDTEGKVVVRQRLAGPLAVELDLRDFPFDAQRLTIEVVSYEYSPAEIVFSADSELVADLDRLSGDGWAYTATEMEPYEFRLRDGARAASALRFAVSAERKPAYFVFTLALPMTLILFLGWMVHWLPVDVIPARIGTASATVFSLIAFGVSFRLTLPKIAYLTDADRFVLYATLLVLVSLAVTIVTIRWTNTERIAAAERLTRQARLAFPVLFGLIVLLTLAT